jgi:hypothetical protein
LAAIAVLSLLLTKFTPTHNGKDFTARSGLFAGFASSEYSFIHGVLHLNLNPSYSLLVSKKSVVLFVAHDNPAAQKVYRRVGFAGLDDDVECEVEGVDSWLEIGFDRNKVDFGHW